LLREKKQAPKRLQFGGGHLSLNWLKAELFATLPVLGHFFVAGLVIHLKYFAVVTQALDRGLEQFFFREVALIVEVAVFVFDQPNASVLFCRPVPAYVDVVADFYDVSAGKLVCADSAEAAVAGARAGGLDGGIVCSHGVLQEVSACTIASDECIVFAFCEQVKRFLQIN
jgi:hypothetical protein